MDVNQLMIDYFEGDLNIEKEHELFSNLSTDESLRAEFRSLMNINNSFKGSLDAFVPSSSSTNAIFSKLGYSMPPANPVSIITPSRLMQFKGLLGYGLATALSSVLSIGIMMALFIQKNVTTENKIIHPIQKIVENKQPDIKSDIPVITSLQSDKKQKSLNNTRIFQTTNTPVKDNINPIESGKKILNNNFTQPGLVSYSTTNSTRYSEKLIIPYNSINQIPIIVDEEPLLEQSFTDNSFKKFTVSFKSSSNWNIPKETISPALLSKFNNLNVTILYNLSDYLSAGFDLRQETFYVKYLGTENQDIKFQYEQQPNLTSYGAAMKVNFTNQALNPFGQFAVSLNNFGYILRVMPGIEYSLYEDFSFIFGVEYSKMFFKHQSTNYNTQKIGLSYGMSYKF